MIRIDYRYLADRERDDLRLHDRAYALGDRVGELVVVLVIFAASIRW